MDKPLAIKPGDQVLMADDTVVLSREELQAALKGGATRLVIGGDRYPGKLNERPFVDEIEIASLHPEERTDSRCSQEGP